MKNHLKKRYHPSFEQLEDRRTPAGNVTASVSFGTLTITGDALGNNVGISQKGFKQVTVDCFPDANLVATNLNGQANGTYVASDVTNVVVNLNAGNDLLIFDIFFGPITLPGNLTINMGAGNDTITPTGGDNFFSIFGNLSVTGGAGNSKTTFINTNVGGAASFRHSAAGDTFLQIATSAPVDNSWRSLAVVNGIGNDFIDISDTSFSGSVNIINGMAGVLGGADVLFKAVHSTSLLTIGGSVLVTNSNGGAGFQIDDYNVGGNITVNAGNSLFNSLNIEQGPILAVGCSIRGNVSLSAHGVATLVFVGGTGVPCEIDGGLTVNLAGSSGFCGVFLNDLASVGNISFTGRIVIIGGNGTDDIEIDNRGSGSNFNGALSIYTGAGNDTVTINGAGTRPTSFFSTVNVNQGAGDDSLELGNTGMVAFFAAATFYGGSDLNNTLFMNPANLNGPIPPTFIHFHP